MGLKWASMTGYAILVLVLLGLIARNSILANSPAAIAAQVLAGLLMVWARMTFGWRSFHASANPTEGGLVTTGPYRYLRHPIYAAILLFLAAAALSHLSLANILLALAACAAVALRMIAEERLLAERYPDYAAYAARTKRIIPFVL
jgi:protein-S-isoprenylcysteine O-methyltransferase Ste14